MDSQNIIQPKRSTILHIRSKDATQLTTGYNTNFDINLTNAIIINENEEIHISIMSAEIPYSFYNVSTELENNKLVYDDTNTLTFTSQDYDIDELVEFFEANTAFKAIFTTTYNTQTNKISFKNTTGVTHKINLSLSNVNKEIGFSESDTDRTITAGSTLTSDFVCNLATVHSIFIKSSLSTANVLSTRAGNSTTLQKISVDTNSLGIIYMNSGDFRQVTVSQVKQGLKEIITLIINNQSRNIISNRRTVNIPTQPQNIVRLPTNLVIDELDNTHPIENKSEVKHKTDRIVLDNLLDIVSDQ